MEHKIKNWVLGLLFSVLPFITEAGYDDCVDACRAQKAGEGIECDRSFIQDASGGKLTIRAKQVNWWRRQMRTTEGDEIIVIEGTLTRPQRMNPRKSRFILTEKSGSFSHFDSGNLATICYRNEVCRSKYRCEIVDLGNNVDDCRNWCK